MDGDMAYDQLCFGCGYGSMCVNNQPFLISTTESDDGFENAKPDGLVGMAYDSLAISGTTTPFSKLMRSATCQQKVFAFWLNQNQRDYEGGEMTICGIDPNHYTGPLIYTQVTKQKYWQFTVDSLRVKGGLVSSNFQAIADTGTSLITGPYNEILSLYNYIGVAYNYYYGAGTIDCRKINTLPNVTFTISGQQFTLTPWNYVIRPDKSKMCLVGFQVLALEDDLWILGDVFLGAYYTVFDQGNNRLGFAQSSPPVKGATTIRNGYGYMIWCFAVAILIALKSK